MTDVVGVNVGARTAVGLNALQTGFLLRAGYPAMAEAPIAGADGKPITMAFLPTIDGQLVGAERLAALAHGGGDEEVLEDLGGFAVDRAHDVARLEAGLFRGRSGHDATDDGRGLVEAAGEEDGDEEDGGEDDVHHDARADDDHALPHGFLRV